MQQLLKWLGGLNGNEAALGALTSLLTPVVVVVWRVAVAARKQREKDMAAVPPTPAAKLPDPQLEALSERLRDVEREADVARLRWRYQATLDELRLAHLDREALSNALTTERAENALLRAEIESLQRDTMRPPARRP